jgi:hypothetical protein
VRVAQVLRIIAVSVVTDGEVELSVRTEPDAAADVQQLRGRLRLEKRVWAVGADILRRVETNEMVQEVMPGVIEVHVMVSDSEVGIERDADQPTVTGGLGRKVGERLR